MNSSDKIRLAFRLDDPSSRSDHALELVIIQALAKYGIPATFAVIPYVATEDESVPLSADDIPHLLAAHRSGSIEIALHGFNHRRHALLSDNNQTEFATRSLEEQSGLLLKGRSCLQEIFGSVVGFVPPWNSFDGDTLRALERQGFEYLSAGWDYTPEGLDQFPALPHSCNLPEVESAIAEARELRHLSPAVLVIMHHYDFAESGSEQARIDLDRFDSLLRHVSTQPDIEVVTLAQLAKSLGAASCAANIRYHHWRHRQHWRLNRLLPQRILLGVAPTGLRNGVIRHAARHIGRLFA